MKKEQKGERRLVAIMFTDMVGYSALSQKNERLALALLEEHRRILRQIFPKFHGSEIETAGDSFFVEFVSSLDAVRCAIRIQKSLRNRNAKTLPERHILLRIGLHAGDVVRQGKHVHGDEVNIAARIEPCAAPGGICVSETVARQLMNKTDISLLKLGRAELKNIQIPQDIYKIVLPWEMKRSRILLRLKFAMRRKRYAGALFSLALLALLLYGLWLSKATVEENSIAVLPFKNLSDSRENEYFSDGITAEVIAQVSKISRLKVISMTSAMHYKNSDKKLGDIGRELNVATVLEGNVRRVGDHVRVVAQLIDVDSEQQRWGETYDKNLAQIFAIQADVARNIADAMRTTVAPVEEERLRAEGTDDLEAYDLYLRGRHLLNKFRTPEAFKESILYFNKAIHKDTSYAAAYAGLADAYLLLGNFNVLAPQEAYPLARDAALRALQINESLGEAHTTLAFAKMYFEWDWESADKEFKRALELNPSSARAHAWYSIYLTLMGQTDEALRESNLALSLDPLSVVTRADAGLTFYFTRKYDYAIEQYEKTLQMDPSFAVAYLPLGGAYEQKRMYTKAIELFSQASMWSAGHPIAVAGLGHCFALSGKTDDARSMLEVLLQDFEETEDRSYWVGPYWIAVVYAGLGEKGNAMDWLERAYDERDGSLVFMNVDPSLESLHGNERFKALVRRMSFAPRQL